MTAMASSTLNGPHNKQCWSRPYQAPASSRRVGDLEAQSYLRVHPHHLGQPSRLGRERGQRFDASFDCMGCKANDVGCSPACAGCE